MEKHKTFLGYILVLIAAAFFIFPGCNKTVPSEPEATLTPTPNISLAQALDNYDVNWESYTSGGSRWFAQSFDTAGGPDAAQSGTVTAVNGHSMLKGRTDSPGVLRFKWKVNSAAGNASFKLNAAEMLNTSNTGGWVTSSDYVLAQATNVVEWTYKRTTSTAENSGPANLDEVIFSTFTPTCTITPTITPLSIKFRQGEFPNPTFTDLYPVEDTYLDYEHPDENFGKCEILKTGYYGTYLNDVNTILLSFPIKHALPSVTVTPVGAKLHLVSADADASTASVYVYGVSTNAGVWSEGNDCGGVTATAGSTYNDVIAGVVPWNSKSGDDINSFTSNNGLFCNTNFNTVTIVAFEGLRASFMSLFYESYVVHTKGITVRCFNYPNFTRTFYSSDHPDISKRPMLEIYYYQ